MTMSRDDARAYIMPHPNTADHASISLTAGKLRAAINILSPAKDRLADWAEQASKALQKVRPLGGSELFMRLGDEFVADPDYCGAVIDEMRDELYKLRRNAVLQAREHTLQPMGTAPRDGSWILLFGPSGMMTTPLRCEVCRYYPEYRQINPWQTHSNDAFTDGGEAPTAWMPLPLGAKR